MKVPVESSIYWDSVGSQRSTSVGSTGDAYSSGSASRHYVDPWDLENYAYLRRHSVAGLTQQASRRHRRPTYRLTQEARVHSEYWLYGNSTDWQNSISKQTYRLFCYFDKSLRGSKHDYFILFYFMYFTLLYFTLLHFLLLSFLLLSFFLLSFLLLSFILLYIILLYIILLSFLLLSFILHYFILLYFLLLSFILLHIILLYFILLSFILLSFLLLSFILLSFLLLYIILLSFFLLSFILLSFLLLSFILHYFILLSFILLSFLLLYIILLSFILLSFLLLYIILLSFILLYIILLSFLLLSFILHYFILLYFLLLSFILLSFLLLYIILLSFFLFSFILLYIILLSFILLYFNLRYFILLYFILLYFILFYFSLFYSFLFYFTFYQIIRYDKKFVSSIEYIVELMSIYLITSFFQCLRVFFFLSCEKGLYSTSVREPGYDAPAFVEELYCGPARPANNSCYYHQPIYEDEVPDYVAPFPVYAPLSEVRHGEFMEDHRRHRYKSSSMRDLHRSLSAEPNLTPVDSIEIDMPDYRSRQDYRSMEQENYMVQIVPPPHLDLNTYGHLKIDYTNSWNSLNRKIGKEI
ncbi:hypothetical protein ANTQUA_LOCUS9933, partial [Anthophora quadrimaculata]